MSKVVFDASALLALIHGETGQEIAALAVADAAISAVNLAEVVGKLAENGMPLERARALALALGLDIVPLDADLAVLAGQMRPETKRAGLSLGDRCCLATAKILRLPVLTTESAWEPLAGKLGVEIRNIRPRS